MTARPPPSTSVIVAVRNGEATLEACLRSLGSLRYPADRLELVVVDNASTDRTRAILDRHRDALHVVEERRLGPAAARNAGIRASRGDVIALTDADCVVDPEWLAALVTPLEDPSVGIVGGTIRALPPATPIERFGERIHDHRSAILVWKPPYVITMSWAARRELFDRLGGFDESLLRGSDVEFSYRAGRAGYRLAFRPEAILYHRNERSLAGLVHEGWLHGFHGVAVRRRHEQYVAEASVQPASEPEPRWFDGSVPRRFAAAFWLGRRLGRAAGRAASAAADAGGR